MLETCALQTAEHVSAGTGAESGRGDGSSDAVYSAADGQRRVEDLSDRKPAAKSMTADRFEPCRGDAPAVLAVWLSTELTRRDTAFEI
jgi:hypothetical protein